MYDTCLTKFGNFHRWIAFLGIDDFLVLADRQRPLPNFLEEYASYAGLAVNLRTFGSSDHKIRPQGSVRRNYVRCVPQPFFV